MLEDDVGERPHNLFEGAHSNEEHDNPGELRSREHKDQAKKMSSLFFIKRNVIEYSPVQYIAF